MDNKLEDKIVQCLEALEKGQTLDQILSKFPEDAEALRPVLETSVLLSEMRVAHSIQSQSRSKKQFLEQAEALKQGRNKPAPVIGFWRRIFSPIVSVAAILIFLGVGTFFAAQSALPGDVLYSTKRTIEGIRLSLVRDLAGQEDLQQEFQEERLREIQRLVEIGREVEVSFDGVIESIVGEEWVVAGIPVMIGDITQINGVPTVGVNAQITGRTDFGEVYADEVVVAVIEQLTPEPEPTRAPVPTMTPVQDATLDSDPSGTEPETVTETPTSTTAPSRTATATIAATATGTATATNTSVPSPFPTATPTLPSPTSTSLPSPVPATSTTEPPATSTSLPTSTETPMPTATNPPTQTPEPTATDDSNNNNNNNNNNNSPENLYNSGEGGNKNENSQSGGFVELSVGVVLLFAFMVSLSEDMFFKRTG